MAEKTTEKKKPEASTVTLLFTGDGFLDVPDAGLLGIAAGEKFKVNEATAKRLLADDTVAVDATGGK